MTTGRIHSWDLSTGVDGPGTRFVLFVNGCPLRCLYCANQRADAVTVFRVDRASGRLSFTGQHVPVGNPSSIVFVDLARP